MRTCWFHFNQATKRWLKNHGKSHFNDKSKDAFQCFEESEQNQISQILLAIDRFVFLPKDLIQPLLSFLQEESSEHLGLGDFFVYLKTKLTDEYVEKLSWYDAYKATPQVLDMTSNKIESSHQSVQIYLGGYSIVKQTGFLTVLKYSRQYLTVEYNEWEKIRDGEPYKKTVLTEKQQKRLEWLPSWINCIEGRIRLRKNMNTKASLTKMFNLLTKHDF